MYILALSRSSKQETVADSTIESEYIAASEVAKEGVWIKNFVTGLGVVPNILDPLEIFVKRERIS